MTQEEQKLIEAAAAGDLEKVTLLLDDGVNINAVYPDGFNALMYALDNGEKETAQYLIDAGIDLSHKENRDMNALIIAIKNSESDIAKILVERGIDVNDTEQIGATPLFFAVYNQLIDVIRLLLRHGARIDSATTTGDTPLRLAKQGGNAEIINLLQEAATVQEDSDIISKTVDEDIDSHSSDAAIAADNDDDNHITLRSSKASTALGLIHLIFGGSGLLLLGITLIKNNALGRVPYLIVLEHIFTFIVSRPSSAVLAVILPLSLVFAGIGILKLRTNKISYWIAGGIGIVGNLITVLSFILQDPSMNSLWRFGFNLTAAGESTLIVPLLIFLTHTITGRFVDFFQPGPGIYVSLFFIAFWLLHFYLLYRWGLLKIKSDAWQEKDDSDYYENDITDSPDDDLINELERQSDDIHSLTTAGVAIVDTFDEFANRAEALIDEELCNLCLDKILEITRNDGISKEKQITMIERILKQFEAVDKKPEGKRKEFIASQST